MATDHYQAHAAEPLRSWSMILDASAASAHWREAPNCTPWLAAACSPAAFRTLTMLLARIVSRRRLAQRWRGADGGVRGVRKSRGTVLLLIFEAAGCGLVQSCESARSMASCR